MKIMSSRIKILTADSIKKELEPKEFAKLAALKPHMIKRSYFKISDIGSGEFGKFIVEFEDSNEPKLLQLQK